MHFRPPESLYRSRSASGVRWYKAPIMDELGLRTTADLIRYAVQEGLVPG